ncbi:uncharacterized protein LOC122013153 [Zingiber officinale]|nr:uncharacterized protein LOC122013153 [Zingiber officinale]
MSRITNSFFFFLFPFARLRLMSSSSSLMASHGVALATAVAVSGTMILLALCRTKPFSFPAASAAVHDDSAPPWCPQSSCIASAEDAKKARTRTMLKKKKNKKKKRVQFASEVVEFYVSASNEAEEAEDPLPARRMPANREALYKGILRDREMHRMACCY